MEKSLPQPAALPRFWDFRTILNVHIKPREYHQCVAYNRKGFQCEITGWTSGSDLHKAEQLLSEMDRTESLSQCREQLGELARLTVCPSPHRRRLDVQEDCCRRWNEKIST